MRHLRRAVIAISLLAISLPAAAAGCPLPPAPSALHPLEPVAARVGVALGSGSGHALAQIGAIEELESRGLRVDVVTGTSAGAIVGALWASGSTGAEIEKLSRMGEWEIARTRLRQLLPARPIEAWPRRFGAVSTEIATGHRRVTTRGDGVRAVLASSAMPVAFSPVVVDGIELVDGALVEPVPARAARELGADVVIGIDVAYRPYEEPARGRLQSAFQAVHVLVNALAAEQDRHADVIVRMDVHRIYTECGPQAMVYAGRQALRDAWPAIEAALARSRLAAR